MGNAEQTETTTSQDPNMIVEVNVLDPANAGKTPSTRWGRITFDAEGRGVVKLPLKDVPILNQFKWLTQDEQTKWGVGAVQVVETPPGETSQLQQELEATKAALKRYAERCATMEVKFEQELAMARTKIKAELQEELQAGVADIVAENQRLLAANAELTQQIEQLTKPQTGSSAGANPTAKPSDDSSDGKDAKKNAKSGK